MDVIFIHDFGAYLSMIDWDIDSIIETTKVPTAKVPCPAIAEGADVLIRQSNDRHNTADNCRRQYAKFRIEI